MMKSYLSNLSHKKSKKKKKKAPIALNHFMAFVFDSHIKYPNWYELDFYKNQFIFQNCLAFYLNIQLPFMLDFS